MQFGRPIGSFQPIKHKLVSMYVAVQPSAAVVAEAADVLDAQAPGVHLPGPVARTVTAAAAHCTSSYVSVAGDAIQTHGGIGFRWEHPCHRFFMRAWLNQTWLGGEAAMHLTVADLLTADAGLPQPDGAPAAGARRGAPCDRQCTLFLVRTFSSARRSLPSTSGDRQLSLPRST